MAIASPLSGLFKINKKFSSIFSSLDETKKTTIDMKKVALRKTRVKKEAIQGDKKFYQRKNEFLRRKAKEDLIEAKDIITKPIKVIGNVARGFLERILDFMGALLLGWLTYNLPTILTMAREFIARIQRMVDLLKAFVGNIFNIITGFGNVLGAIYQNVISFDFFDTSNRVKNSLDDLGNNFDEMGKQFEEGMKLLTTPLNEGLVTGEDAAPVGTDYTEPSGTPPSGESSSAGGRWKPMLDLISSGEGGYTSMYPSESYPQMLNMTISEVVQFQNQKLRDGRRSAAVGRYQFIDPAYAARLSGLPMDAKFTPENQDKMAIGYLEKKRRGKEWLSGKISNREYIEDLAREWGAFKSYSGYVLPGNSGKIGPQKIEAALNQVKKGSDTSTQPGKGIPQATIKGGITGSTFLLPASAKGADRYVGATDRFGYVPSRGRQHNGIDIGTSGQRGYYVTFLRDGTATIIPNNGGAGNTVEIKSGGTIYKFFHLARFSIKSGPYKAGTVIGEVGKTGRSSDIHLHYEVHPPGTRGVNPEPYLNLITIGKNLSQATPISQPAQSQPASPVSTPQTLPPSAISGSPTQTSAAAQQLSTTKTGQQVVVIDDRQPPQMIPSGGGGGGQPKVIYVGQTLNSFIKNKLLLDLVYT